MARWNYCLDRMPIGIEGRQYLIRLSNGRMAVAECTRPYANEKYARWVGENDAEWEDSEVTHWSQLPPPPDCERTEHLEARRHVE